MALEGQVQAIELFGRVWRPKERGLLSCTSLYISNKDLRSVPDGVSLLTDMKVLDISYNSIRTESLTIISHLTRLRTLCIDRNHLRYIPTSIASLTHLRVLWSSQNKLTVIPPELFLLSCINKLNLGVNLLSQIPPNISAMKNLKILYLGRNQLTTLPEELSALGKLELLDICENRMTCLPSSISILTQLSQMNVSANPVYELPPWFGVLCRLQNIYIDSLGRINVQSAPREITTLPFWNNQSNSDFSSIRALRLYEREA